MTPKQLAKKWPAIEKQMRVGDILMLSRRKGPVARTIQSKTDSYWSHVALVFSQPGDLKFGSPLIVEAVGKGIEVHQLKKYTENLHDYDIGLKRFPGLNKKQRENFVENFILNNVDVPYAYSRLIGFFFANTLMKLTGRRFQWLAEKLSAPDYFICSSFVHKTFNNLTEYDLKVPIIDERFKFLDQEDIYAPGDLADDPVFKWIFNPNH